VSVTILSKSSLPRHDGCVSGPMDHMTKYREQQSTHWANTKQQSCPLEMFKLLDKTRWTTEQTTKQQRCPPEMLHTEFKLLFYKVIAHTFTYMYIQEVCNLLLLVLFLLEWFCDWRWRWFFSTWRSLYTCMIAKLFCI